MAPSKRVAKTPEAAKAAGLTTIHSFFRPMLKAGRRTKNSKSAGRPKKNDLNVVGVKVPKVTTPTGVAVRDKKKTRQSWSSGAGLEKLSQAAEDWAIELTKAIENRKSMRWFAEYNSIPFSTFQEHVCSDAEKRIKLGSKVGKKSLIKASTANVVVDTLIRKDRANQGEDVSGLDMGMRLRLRTSTIFQQIKWPLLIRLRRISQCALSCAMPVAVGQQRSLRSAS